MKKAIIFGILLLILTGIVCAEGLTITLTTPYRIIQNVSVGDTVEEYIGFQNLNSFNVNVTIIEPTCGITIISDLPIELEPDEYSKIDFEINIEEIGTYDCILAILFSTSEEGIEPKSVGFSSVLKFKDIQEETIIVEEPEEDEEPITHSSSSSNNRKKKEPIHIDMSMKKNKTIEKINETNEGEKTAINETINKNIENTIVYVEPIETNNNKSKILRSVVIVIFSLLILLLIIIFIIKLRRFKCSE